jgi:hypothetical protein
VTLDPVDHPVYSLLVGRVILVVWLADFGLEILDCSHPARTAK